MMRTFIIAEIGINHSGNINLAKQMINAAHWAGADAVKFQKRTVDIVYSQGFLNGPRNDGNPYGWKTQREQKEGLELSHDEYCQIDDLCSNIGIDWFASAWDIPSLEFLDDFEPNCHKVASAMTTCLPFLEEVAERGKMTYISTGMCSEEDIKTANKIFNQFPGDEPCPHVFMHTVSTYPAPPESLNLDYVRHLIREYGDAGYSGHEVGLAPSIAAVAMGASVIERHFTLDRTMYGSDQYASVEPDGFRRMVNMIREIEKACAHDNYKFYKGREILPIEEKTVNSLRYFK